MGLVTIALEMWHLSEHPSTILATITFPTWYSIAYSTTLLPSTSILIALIVINI